MVAMKAIKMVKTYENVADIECKSQIMRLISGIRALQYLLQVPGATHITLVQNTVLVRDSKQDFFRQLGSQQSELSI